MRPINLVRSICVLFLALCTSGVLSAEAPLVKQFVLASETNTVAAYPQVSVAGSDFRTAAMVDVTADPNSAGGSVQTARDADRASNYETAAVVAVVGKGPLPATQNALTGAAGAEQRLGFKQSWNSAEGWATTRGNGMPFLDLLVFGKAAASGAASWNAKITMPTSNHLYVRFLLPAVKVNGVVEQDGPSTYQGRFRAEVLVNGHSVWTSEGNRQNVMYSPLQSNACTVNSQKSTVLTEFGASTGLPANSANSSTEKRVTLGLGQFAAGQVVEISLVVRADTQVNRKCCIKTKDGEQESFCTGSSTALTWSETMNPVTFHAGAAI